MDPIILSIAFLLGYLSSRVGLPPMVGFLLTGFVLNGLGIDPGPSLQILADLGVTLLLFTIGLKLRLKSLATPEVWAGASLHMLVTILVFGGGLFLLARTGMPFVSSLSLPTALLVAFALSFSSTVFAIKILEEKAEASSLHGRVSIGILIMQDLFAVLFLTLSLGKAPAAWSICIPVILFGLRPLLFRILDRCGHGELLILFGLFAALAVGAGGFELGGLKADLGALVLGILLSGHKKSKEIAKSLMGIKDLFLIGFFLTIGLAGVPSLATLSISALLVVLIPLKVALFLLLLTRFNLRARSAVLAALSLANYSEFGLIIAVVGAQKGWLSNEWLVIIAIALAISFMVAAPFNTRGDSIYVRFRSRLTRLETGRRHPDDQPIDPQGASIGIFGMGRIGTAAYEALQERYGEAVLGFDFNEEAVARHQAAGRKVLFGDPTDPDFWSRMPRDKQNQVPLVLLAMSKHSANIAAVRHLRTLGYAGCISTIGQFDDQVEALRQAGATDSFNIYGHAGAGFADHALDILETAIGPAQGEPGKGGGPVH